MSEDTIRVLRLVEFVGPRNKVEDQVARSVHGRKLVRENGEVVITAVTLDVYPEILRRHDAEAVPIDMVLYCPECHAQHVDAPEEGAIFSFGESMRERWTNPPHKSHLCHACGWIWRPADVCTNGVAQTKTHGTNDDTTPLTRKTP